MVVGIAKGEKAPSSPVGDNSEIFDKILMDNLVLRMRLSQFTSDDHGDAEIPVAQRFLSSASDGQCAPGDDPATFNRQNVLLSEPNCSCCCFPKACKRSPFLHHRYLCPCDIDVAINVEPDWLARTAKLLGQRCQRPDGGCDDPEQRIEGLDGHEVTKDPALSRLLVALSSATESSNLKVCSNIGFDVDIAERDDCYRGNLLVDGQLSGGLCYVNSSAGIAKNAKNEMGFQRIKHAKENNKNNSSNVSFEQDGANDNRVSNGMRSVLSPTKTRGPDLSATQCTGAIVKDAPQPLKFSLEEACSEESPESEQFSGRLGSCSGGAGLRYRPYPAKPKRRGDLWKRPICKVNFSRNDPRYAVSSGARRCCRGERVRRCPFGERNVYMDPWGGPGAEGAVPGGRFCHCPCLMASHCAGFVPAAHQAFGERRCMHRCCAGGEFFRRGCSDYRAGCVRSRSFTCCQQHPESRMCPSPDYGGFLCRPARGVMALDLLPPTYPVSQTWLGQDGFQGQQTRNNSCLGTSTGVTDNCPHTGPRVVRDVNKYESNSDLMIDLNIPSYLNSRKETALESSARAQKVADDFKFSFSSPQIVSEGNHHSVKPSLTFAALCQSGVPKQSLSCSPSWMRKPQRSPANEALFKHWAQPYTEAKGEEHAQHISWYSHNSLLHNDAQISSHPWLIFNVCTNNDLQRERPPISNSLLDDAADSEKAFHTNTIASTETLCYHQNVQGGGEDITTNNNNNDLPQHVNNNSSNQLQPFVRGREQLSGRIVRVEGDGRCLFRSLATAENLSLQHVNRDEFGRPVTRELADQETVRADQLRARVVQIMTDNLHFYSQLERGVINADQPLPSSYQRFRDRLSAMSDPSTMPGDLELNAVALVMERQILVVDTNLAVITSYGHDRFPQPLPLAVRYTRLVADVGHYDAVILRDHHHAMVSGQRDTGSGHPGTPVDDASRHSGLCVEFRRLTTSGDGQGGTGEGRPTSCPRDATLNAKKEFFYLRDTDKALHSEGLQPVSANTRPASGQRTVEAATSTARAAVNWPSDLVRKTRRCGGRKARAFSDKHTQTDWEGAEEARWMKTKCRRGPRRAATRSKREVRGKHRRVGVAKYKLMVMPAQGKGHRNMNWNSCARKGAVVGKACQNKSANAIERKSFKANCRKMRAAKNRRDANNQLAALFAFKQNKGSRPSNTANKGHKSKTGHFRNGKARTIKARFVEDFSKFLISRRHAANISANSSSGDRRTPGTYINVCAPIRRPRLEKPVSRKPTPKRRAQSSHPNGGRSDRVPPLLPLSPPSSSLFPNRLRLPDVFQQAACRCVLCNTKVEAATRDGVQCYLCGRIAHRACALREMPGSSQGGGDQNYFLCSYCVPL